NRLFTPLCPYTTLFRSMTARWTLLSSSCATACRCKSSRCATQRLTLWPMLAQQPRQPTREERSNRERHYPDKRRFRSAPRPRGRSEEHTSELQSRENLV